MRLAKSNGVALRRCMRLWPRIVWSVRWHSIHMSFCVCAFVPFVLTLHVSKHLSAPVRGVKLLLTLLWGNGKALTPTSVSRTRRSPSHSSGRTTARRPSAREAPTGDTSSRWCPGRAFAGLRDRCRGRCCHEKIKNIVKAVRLRYMWNGYVYGCGRTNQLWKGKVNVSQLDIRMKGR